jgi:broad specificity phosphatase PhoE
MVEAPQSALGFGPALGAIVRVDAVARLADPPVAMNGPHRILLVRHGETVGESSIRYYGATDVELSALGRSQAFSASLALPGDAFDLVIASPLHRAWESATLVMPGRPIRLEADLREVDFGEWEGLTAEEIEARDPIRYEDWKTGRPGFEYPAGERQAHFRERIAGAVDRILESQARSVLVVVHKGVIRAIVRRVAGRELEPGEPELGGSVQLTRDASGEWCVGRRASGPKGIRASR